MSILFEEGQRVIRNKKGIEITPFSEGQSSLSVFMAISPKIPCIEVKPGREDYPFMHIGSKLAVRTLIDYLQQAEREMEE